MAVGKNKRLSKGKKGLKKKVIDPFSRKEWYELKAPSMFTKSTVGKTLVNRTQGMKSSEDALKGRVFELSLGDLNNESEEIAYRKFKLRVDEIQGRHCLTNFHGMDFTSDKIRSMVRKWQSLIEGHIDVKTVDGYLLRVFCIAFTKRRQNQLKRTAYAQTSQIRQIRKKMFEIITREVTTSELKDVVSKLIPDSIAKEIERQGSAIFPLHNVAIRKVKLLKMPKYDAQKLLELHTISGNSDETGMKVERSAKWEEPKPSKKI